MKAQPSSLWNVHGAAPSPRPAQLPPSRPFCTRRQCIPQLVEAASLRDPDALALEGPDGARCSYALLNRRANALAAYLHTLGVGPDTAVAISLPRSFDFVIAALAVWKAGGAYLPLDPSWPAQRRQMIIDDAQAPVLITKAPNLFRARYIVDIDHDGHDASASFSPYHNRREDLACVLYTPGTTGAPKGVEVTHGNLLNLAFWHRRAFGVTAADRASHLSGLGFAAAVWELWPYLTAGAAVVMPDESIRTSPELLREWISAQTVTLALVPAALAEPLIASRWPRETALRFLLTGSDTLHRYPASGLPFRVINHYGPTETTVVATSGEIKPDPADALPTIGAPISNAHIYVLDPAQHPVPPGDIGEIYIGGTCVARGYRNRPDLTAERFFENPFSISTEARMYRTGDLGRFLPDGQIAFCGRLDQQEKIGGLRIEADEIVRVLDRHPGVVSSAVVARAMGSGKTLIAYVVPAAGPELTAAALRDFLARQLPEYMIPAIFVRIGELPLNSSGKLDRDGLPAPSADNSLTASEFRAASSPVEMQVSAMLKELLNLDRVGLDDNFFLPGGHSLPGAQLVARIHERFGVELSLLDLFETRTVANLSSEIEKKIVAQVHSMNEQAARLRASDSR